MTLRLHETMSMLCDGYGFEKKKKKESRSVVELTGLVVKMHDGKCKHSHCYIRAISLILLHQF